MIQKIKLGIHVYNMQYKISEASTTGLSNLVFSTCPRWALYRPGKEQVLFWKEQGVIFSTQGTLLIKVEEDCLVIALNTTGYSSSSLFSWWPIWWTH